MAKIQDNVKTDTFGETIPSETFGEKSVPFETRNEKAPVDTFGAKVPSETFGEKAYNEDGFAAIAPGVPVGCASELGVVESEHAEKEVAEARERQQATEKQATEARKQQHEAAKELASAQERTATLELQSAEEWEKAASKRLSNAQDRITELELASTNEQRRVAAQMLVSATELAATRIELQEAAQELASAKARTFALRSSFVQKKPEFDVKLASAQEIAEAQRITDERKENSDAVYQQQTEQPSQILRKP